MIETPRTPQEHLIAQIRACIPADLEEQALLALSLGFASAISFSLFVSEGLITLDVPTLEHWYARIRQATAGRDTPMYTCV